MIVHQIFGLLGDTELSQLFLDCQKKVINFCQINNYDYYLWDKIKCNHLIRKYQEFYDLYNSVKYDIMRVDIIRFLILYEYGGLYIDLDCYPVENLKLLECDFAVAKTRLTYKPYEMEILQSKKNNEILLEYLRYVKNQVIIKNEIAIYKKWKCRYVYQTTGPMCLCRFLKNKHFCSYLINSPSYQKKENTNIFGDECFISHISCCYK